jgi:hypothetical protein
MLWLRQLATVESASLAALDILSTRTIGTWSVNGSAFLISDVSVLAPLPLLAGGGACGWSRQLKRRINGDASRPAKQR